MVLQHHSVLYHGHIRAIEISAILLEDRSRVDDIIYIPLSRLAHGIHQGRCLLVDAACHAVYICLVVIAVQYLHLIHILQEDAAVATSLALALYSLWHTPFDVQLETAKLLFGNDIAFALVHSHDSLLHRPSCLGSTVAVGPGREVLAVKEHNGIIGC